MKRPGKLINRFLNKWGYRLGKLDHNQQQKPFQQKTYHNLELPKKDAYEAQEKILSISKTSVETIFDVGANDGHITGRYRQIFPKATIYSFEPFSEPFRLLSRRSEKWGRVVPVNAAVTAKKGTRDLFLNKHHVTNSLLPTVPDVEKHVDIAVIENIDKVRVPVTTIDDFCAEHNINDIQILKMDIQGSELEALKGAKKKLSQQRVSLIYTEIWFVNVYRGQPLFYELYQFLDKYGYELYDFYNFVYSEEDKIKWADAIFVNEKIVKEITASGGQGGAF
jgi:FkbM family methyltransferase